MKWYEALTFVFLLVGSASCVSFGWLYILRPSFQPSALTNLPRASCSISIQKDLSKASPLLLKSTSVVTGSANDAYYLPSNRYGDISFNQDDIINLSCPNGKVFLNGKNTNQDLVAVRCTSGKTFELTTTKETATLSQFKCSKPGQSARYTGKTCLGSYKEIEIGFQITSNNFIREITVCFDSVEQSAAYSAYNLTKYIKGSQYSTPRPQFEDGGFYNTGNHQVYNLYSAYVQKLNVNKQLGLDQNSNKYIKSNSDYFLSRGHLTAKADFVYGHQHNATFFYVNAAPQWQTFNEGNWNEVEKSVRQLAGDRNLDLEVYTGTHGVMTLPHEQSGVQTPVYLYNENGRRGIPVPRLYWKVVYDRKTKAGIAFVGLNNPYNKAISEEVLCTDICNQVKFNVSWNRTNVDLGYGYCCNVNDLRLKVKNIPNIAVNSVLV